MDRTETNSRVISARVSERLYAKIVAEQKRLTELTGIRQTINEVFRMLLERGLKTGSADNRAIRRKSTAS
jgi:hypothetical protein